MSKPILIFDGDCGFCRHWIAYWQSLTGDRVDYAPYQEVASRFPQIPLEHFVKAVQLMDWDGQVYGAAAAVFKSLTYSAGMGWLYKIYRASPAFASASEWIYRLVAGRRWIFSRLTYLLWGSEVRPSTYFASRWIFLRLMAVVYFAAFFSMDGQITGLLGSEGILPVRDLMAQARSHLGETRFDLLPTIFWWNDSDSFLRQVCFAGEILSALLFLGIFPQICLILLWLLYLSIASVGREFLGFQWDILLLETGLLAVFLAPFQAVPRPSREDPPSRLALWLSRILLFKLMFSSGVIKLSSGDAAWKNLTALNVHFETQPLPHALSWFVHQAPEWFMRVATAGMFGIELFVPFLIFLPRRPKIAAAAALIFLQILIIATGNYCFFNLLTIALCALLIDDAAYPPRVREWFGAQGGEKLRLAWARRAVLIPFATIILLLTPIHIAGAFRWRAEWPQLILRLENAVSPFRSVGGYGLFAVMTPSRPEIIVEGSVDGVEWKPYAFKYKPGDVTRAPRWAAPHQPRLDWQMWFAALSGYQQNPWFVNFCVRLLQGSPPVLGLLAENPFPGAPPKFIRAVVRDYRFTDFDERRQSGAWWKTQPLGLYLPVISLRENAR